MKQKVVIDKKKKTVVLIEMETSGLNPNNKARVVHNERLAEMLKDVPLKTRLKVVNEMMIQSYLIDQKFIPDGYWSDEKEKMYGHFRKFAKELTEAQMKEFKEWEKDGKPK